MAGGLSAERAEGQNGLTHSYVHFAGNGVGGTQKGARAHTEKGERKGIVSEAGRLENERTAFVFSFCGERIWGGMGSCTGVGKGFVQKERRPTLVRAEGATPTRSGT